MPKISSKKQVGSSRRRHPHGPDLRYLEEVDSSLGGIGHLSSLRGVSLDKVVAAYDSGREGTQLSTNEILDRLGVPNEPARRRLLAQFNGDTCYGGRVLRDAYRLATEFGFSYKEGDPGKVQQLIGIARLLHHNEESSLRFILNLVGLHNISDASSRVEGYSPLEVGEQQVLLPKRFVKGITREFGGLTRLFPVDIFMMLEGYSRQDYFGVMAYFKK